jgi:hypothetical protein
MLFAKLDRMGVVLEMEEADELPEGFTLINGSYGTPTAVGDFVRNGWSWPASSVDMAFEARQFRTSLLLASDWTQLADTSDIHGETWAPYRLALRDVPQQAGFPIGIVWPDEPV